MKKVAVLLALVASLFLMLPGAHAADAAGEVTGNVQITNAGGIPIQGCAFTTYTFSSVILNGALSSNGVHWAGSITTAGVQGKSTMCETTAAGGGVVNGPGGVGQLPPATFSGSNAYGSISGTFYGTYTRTESIVLVSLNVSFTGTNALGQTQTGNIPNLQVRAQFTPTQLDPTTFGIIEAAFAGEFSSV